MFKVIISSIIVVISLFIGFFPHTESCGIAQHNCPGWQFHIIVGTLLYILAVLISQGSFDFIISYVASYTSNTVKDILPPSDTHVPVVV
jgi:hypothetical protein